jgi:hypothetical protein
MYTCTRHDAIVELGMEDQVDDPDPWAVKIHIEFADLADKIKYGKS